MPWANLMKNGDLVVESQLLIFFVQCFDNVVERSFWGILGNENPFGAVGFWFALADECDETGMVANFQEG